MKKYFKFAIIGIIVGICNGLFGSGGGTVAVPCMEKFLGVEKKKAHATAIALILPLTIVSIFFYTQKGYFDFKLVWQTSIGGVFGGVLGAYILKKLKPDTIAKIFGIFLIIAAIRMVFK
ncbi:MAG: sulfite exporter TauE/SafE family protein [Ruminococcaceae bacterium]|nr:sulfite exporter TauE/SafE family protein [Oscillospiraceae bacterium]